MVRAFSHIGFPACKCIKKSIKHREDFPLQDSPHTLFSFFYRTKASHISSLIQLSPYEGNSVCWVVRL